MRTIHPVICQGYCMFYHPIYVNEHDLSLPYSTDDIAEKQGWITTTNRKFSMDGKSVVWLCPECSRKWNSERQVRIDEIMRLALKDMTEGQYWNLVAELYSLDATKEEKDKFSKLLFPVRI